MKNLPNEFVLTDFDVKEGNEVLQYHGFGDKLGCRWVYIVVTKPVDYTDSEAYLTRYSHLPRLSYQQWKEIVSPNVQETFPERWYINVTTENRDVLNKWRHDNHSVSSDQFFKTENAARLYSHDVSGDMTYFDISPLREYSQYVEITFDQFKKFVLKEDNVEIYAHTIDIFQLRELYNNANKDGKEFLEKLFKGCDVFWELFYLNNVDIDFLRGNCNKEIVNKIFDEVIDFEKLQVGSKVELKDGTIGQIVILKSKHYMAGDLMKLKRILNQSWDATTILIHDEEFRNIEYDMFLKEIKTVIEY